MDLIETGKKLYQLRKRKNLRQKDIAEKVGITESYVSLLEKGEGNPTIKVLHAISQAVDGYLFMAVYENNPQIEQVIKEMIRLTTEDLKLVWKICRVLQRIQPTNRDLLSSQIDILYKSCQFEEEGEQQRASNM